MYTHTSTHYKNSRVWHLFISKNCCHYLELSKRCESFENKQQLINFVINNCFGWKIWRSLNICHGKWKSKYWFWSHQTVYDGKYSWIYRPTLDIGTNVREMYTLNMLDYRANHPTDVLFCNLLEIDPYHLQNTNGKMHNSNGTETASDELVPRKFSRSTYRHWNTITRMQPPKCEFWEAKHFLE